MAEDVTFVMHKEWLDSIAGLPLEQQDKVIAEIVRYGTGCGLAYENDPVIMAFVNLLKSRIDFSKNKYNQKVEMSKSAGRKKKVDDEKILRLAREGKSAQQIADMLGCSKSSIDHSEGWRNRKIAREEATEKIELKVEEPQKVFYEF